MASFASSATRVAHASTPGPTYYKTNLIKRWEYKVIFIQKEKLHKYYEDNPSIFLLKYVICAALDLIKTFQ